MKVMLATLCLNEMQWLKNLYEQHKSWPGMVNWVFVEGADPVFRETNHELIGGNGLSTDGTSQYLSQLAKIDNKVVYVPIVDVQKAVHADQGKCHLRNWYMHFADEIQPEIIVVIDGDEFYTKDDQTKINDIVSCWRSYDAWMFRQRHLWRPPYLQEKWGLNFSFPSEEIVGGYWSVPHTRVWKWSKHLRYIKNHNWLELEGVYLTKNMMRCDLNDRETGPQCVHLGYASSGETRRAKHEYYKARGEGSEGGRLGARRSMYLDCRDAWERWKPGDELPHGARVVPYSGPVPEVFR